MRRTHREEGLRALNARRTKREMDRWKKFFLFWCCNVWSRLGEEAKNIATLPETLSSRNDALCAIA